jgi:hypothetical protein
MAQLAGGYPPVIYLEKDPRWEALGKGLADLAQASGVGQYLDQRRRARMMNQMSSMSPDQQDQYMMSQALPGDEPFIKDLITLRQQRITDQYNTMRIQVEQARVAATLARIDSQNKLAAANAALAAARTTGIPSQIGKSQADAAKAAADANLANQRANAIQTQSDALKGYLGGGGTAPGTTTPPNRLSPNLPPIPPQVLTDPNLNQQRFIAPGPPGGPQLTPTREMMLPPAPPAQAPQTSAAPVPQPPPSVVPAGQMMPPGTPQPARLPIVPAIDITRGGQAGAQAIRAQDITAPPPPAPGQAGRATGQVAPASVAATPPITLRGDGESASDVQLTKNYVSGGVPKNELGQIMDIQDGLRYGTIVDPTIAKGAPDVPISTKEGQGLAMQAGGTGGSMGRSAIELQEPTGAPRERKTGIPGVVVDTDLYRADNRERIVRGSMRLDTKPVTQDMTRAIGGIELWYQTNEVMKRLLSAKDSQTGDSVLGGRLTKYFDRLRQRFGLSATGSDSVAEIKNQLYATLQHNIIGGTAMLIGLRPGVTMLKELNEALAKPWQDPGVVQARIAASEATAEGVVYNYASSLAHGGYDIPPSLKDLVKAMSLDRKGVDMNAVRDRYMNAFSKLPGIKFTDPGEFDMSPADVERKFPGLQEGGDATAGPRLAPNVTVGPYSPGSP